MNLHVIGDIRRRPYGDERASGDEPVLDDAREGLHVGTDILGDPDLFLVGGAFADGASEDLEQASRVLGEEGLYE